MTSLSILEQSRKVRFSRRAWMLLAGGVLAVAYFALAGSLFRHHLDKDRLSSQIDSAGSVLAASDEVHRDLEDLDERLAAANGDLAAAQSAFPSELDSNATLGSVLTLAADHGVRLLAVDAAAPGEEPDTDAGPYEVLSLDLQAEGEFRSLVSFLEALQDGAAGAVEIAAFDFQAAGERHLLDLELQAYARNEAAGTPDAGGEDQGTEAASEDSPAGEEGAQ